MDTLLRGKSPLRPRNLNWQLKLTFYSVERDRRAVLGGLIWL